MMRTLKNLFKYAALLHALFFWASCQSNKTADPARSFALNEITVSQIQQAYNAGRYSVREIVQLYIDRIKAIDRDGYKLNSIIIINLDALTIADSLDQLLKAGQKSGPLFGIPVILKDNIDTHDQMPTTAGSRVLKDSYPRRDSWVAKSCARQVRLSWAKLI